MSTLSTSKHGGIRRVRRKGLSLMERLFVRALAAPAPDLAGRGRAALVAAAAVAAGCAVEHAQAVGYRMLQRARVRRAYERRLARRIPGKSVILSDLAEVALSPWRDFVQVQTDDQGGTVAATLQLRDRNRAAELLLRAQGAFEDPVRQRLGRLLLKELRLYEQAKRRARASGASLPDTMPTSPSIHAGARDVSQGDIMDAVPLLAAPTVGAPTIPPPPFARPAPRK